MKVEMRGQTSRSNNHQMGWSTVNQLRGWLTMGRSTVNQLKSQLALRLIVVDGRRALTQSISNHPIGLET